MLLKDLLERQPDDTLIYLEQKVNHLLQTGERIIDVPEQYQPDKGAEYLMPYVWLNLNNPEVEYFEAQPDPRLISQVRQDDSVKFFIHPAMIAEYEKEGFSDLLSFAGHQKVAATASTRTVMTEGLHYNFMIKANMTRQVGFLSRHLKRGAVAHSNQIITTELAEIENLIPSSLAYLPESIGVVYKEEIGMILRECQARPKIQEQRYLIPFFSLISLDSKRETSSPLLCQIVEKKDKEPFDAFLETILEPLLEAWAYLVFERGIIPVAHSQNILLELSAGGKPTRIVFRDIQDAGIDRAGRRQKGLHCDFARNFIDDLNHSGLRVGSEDIVDGEIARKIRYSLAYDFWIGLILDCFTTVLSKFPSCTEERTISAANDFFQAHIQDRAGTLFPPDQFRIERIDADQRTRIVENKGKPKYR